MIKILIVDDDYAIRLLYEEELIDEGYCVSTTHDFKNLMDIIRTYRPDIVVLGIVMDQYDGLDILQDIRNNFYEMPVILCSSYCSFKHDLRSLAADYYVTKSADLTELKSKIKMALETVDDCMGLPFSEAPAPVYCRM